MKRHLSACHRVPEEDLKDGCLDKLKCNKEARETRAEGTFRGRRPKNMQVDLIIVS